MGRRAASRSERRTIQRRLCSLMPGSLPVRRRRRIVSHRSPKTCERYRTFTNSLDMARLDWHHSAILHRGRSLNDPPSSQVPLELRDADLRLCLRLAGENVAYLA